MPIKIIMADDHAIVMEGIKAVLERCSKDIVVIGSVLSGKKLLELARKKTADVYVIDIAMPALNGIDTAARLLLKDKNAKIIFMSMYNNESIIEKALRTGAKGYLVKENAVEEIIKAVHAVNRGEYYLTPTISSFVIDSLISKSNNKFKTENCDKLTLKEREIIQLIAEGMANKEIARQLGISINTVHTHRNNIARKLNIHKQTELARYAFKENIAQL